jgi:hypothetical protein
VVCIPVEDKGFKGGITVEVKGFKGGVYTSRRQGF